MMKLYHLSLTNPLFWQDLRGQIKKEIKKDRPLLTGKDQNEIKNENLEDDIILKKKPKQQKQTNIFTREKQPPP